MAYKTPAVYVEEISTLAPSLVAVETAIPAFIGYTETVVDTTAGNAVGAVSPRVGSTERRYRLFSAVRHYYANGGGPCYIVSVGSYSDAPVVGTATTGLLGGLTSVAPVDDPTLLVFP